MPLVAIPAAYWAAAAAVTAITATYVWVESGGAEKTTQALQNLADSMSRSDDEAETKPDQGSVVEPCSECESKDDGRERPYEGETPNDKPGDFNHARGRKGRIKKSDGSYWEKDFLDTVVPNGSAGPAYAMRKEDEDESPLEKMEV